MKDFTLAIICTIVILQCMQVHAQSWNSIEDQRQEVYESLDGAFYEQTEGKLFLMHESSVQAWMKNGALKNNINVKLPLPSGKIIALQVHKNALIPQQLQERFPQVKSYTGIYAGQTVYVDYGKNGLHAMLFLDGGTIYIDPIEPGSDIYIAYDREDFVPENTQWHCSFDMAEHLPEGIETLPPIVTENRHEEQEKISSTSTIKTFRLALACTGEYARFYGGETASVFSAMVTTMNRVNGIYRRDFGVQMQFIPNNDTLIFLDASTDPYSNFNPGRLLTENQQTVDAIIGTAHYDIGHVFSTGGGGVAYIRSVCNERIKARGVTGKSSPIGDPYDVDYVAHEMGHQFGGSHSFNNSCNGNRADITAFEPGSGYSIMGYAGICPPNVQQHSDALFHGGNIQQMLDFIDGLSCPAVETYENTPPQLTLEDTFYLIPARTPFFLDVDAVDADGDKLTYSWEQYDIGIAPQPPQASSIIGPLFRGYLPVEKSRRYFPKMSAVRNGRALTWEVLPSVSRNMEFGVTVRDNHTEAPRTAQAFVDVETYDTGKEFKITYPMDLNFSIPESSILKLRWETAETENAPINAKSVDVLLTGVLGLNVLDTIASDISNDGAYPIPFIYSPDENYRIIVKGHDNIFYNISNIIQVNQGLNMKQISDDNLLCSGSSDTVQVQIPGEYTDTIDIAMLDMPQGMTYRLMQDEFYGGDTLGIILEDDGTVMPGQYDIGIRFSVLGVEDTLSIPYIVSSSTLSKPENLQLTVLGNSLIDIRWEGNNVGIQYEIQLSSDQTFDTILKDFIVDQVNSYEIQAGQVGENFLRIRAFNRCDTSAWTMQSIITDCGVVNLLDERYVGDEFWTEESGEDAGVIRKKKGNYIAYLGTEDDENISSLSATFAFDGAIKSGLLTFFYEVEKERFTCTSDIRFEIRNEEGELLASKTFDECMDDGTRGKFSLSLNCARVGAELTLSIQSVSNTYSRYYMKISRIEYQRCNTICRLPDRPAQELADLSSSSTCIFSPTSDFQYLMATTDSMIVGINPQGEKIGTYNVSVIQAPQERYISNAGVEVAIATRSYEIDNIEDCSSASTYTARLFLNKEEFAFIQAHNPDVKSLSDLGVSMLSSTAIDLNTEKKILLETTVPQSINLPDDIMAIDVEVPRKDGILLIHALKDTLADVWYELRAEASPEDTTILIDWEVKADNDLEMIIVERSVDRLSFLPIDTATFTGLESFPRAYSSVDKNIETETAYYYRLHVLNEDGETYYTQLVKAGIDITASTDPIRKQVLIYPNPHRDFFTFTMSSAAAYKIEIYNSVGQLVDVVQFYGSQYRYESTSMQSGVYYIKLYQNKEFMTVRSVIKMR